MLLIVDDDSRFRTGAVELGDALESRGSDDGKVFAEILELFLAGSSQQLVDEHVLAGQLGDHAERLLVLGICAGEAVEHEYVLVLQVSDYLVIDSVGLLLGDGLVDASPGDLVVHAFAVDDEFIVGGAAGVLAGLDHESTGSAEGAFPSSECVFREFRRR